eukprot:scaffold14589_cov106-Cylindrotheca_fusiformis.AAC.2
MCWRPQKTLPGKTHAASAKSTKTTSFTASVFGKNKDRTKECSEGQRNGLIHFIIPTKPHTTQKVFEFRKLATNPSSRRTDQGVVEALEFFHIKSQRT